MKNLSDYPREKQTLIILGIVAVCLGVLGLVNGYLSVVWWNMLIRGVVRVVRSLMPAALVGLGILAIWAQRTGRLQGASHPPPKSRAHRSLSDRRILGVCGGIAQSRGMDSMVVRLATLLLFVAFPLFTTVAYLILAAAMAPE